MLNLNLMANDSNNQTLISIFLEEAAELAASLAHLYQEWAQDLNNLDKILQLKSNLHTLKGAACMVGQQEIGTLAHAMETLCSAIIDKQVSINNALYPDIGLGLDHISLMLAALSKNEVPPAPDLLIQRFQNYLPEEFEATAVVEKGNAKEKETAEIVKSTSPADSTLIMIIDDSISIRTFLQNLLERHHHNVVTAEDGFDALEKLKVLESKPDVILLDLDMPRMGGFELAGILQKDEHFKHIPIIIMSAMGNVARRQQARALNVFSFLDKPFEEMDLISEIELILSKNI